ncbi:hypothetical protein OROMI_028026 [Orobanche minor]
MKLRKYYAIWFRFLFSHWNRIIPGMCRHVWADGHGEFQRSSNSVPYGAPLYMLHQSNMLISTHISNKNRIINATCLKLLRIFRQGILASGIMWAFVMSCVRMRGPLFVSVFNPLLLVLVALAGSLFLNEKLHLGSVLGAAIIICGLYSVLWGKVKEMKKITRLVPSKSFTERAEVDEITKDDQTFKDFNDDGNIVMVVTPNFLPDSEIIEVSDEGEDFEASKVFNP